jgi:CTP synthase (UTP-ammonia lyase)
MPLFLESTPRVTTVEELWKTATPERYASYCGKSVSMVDHIYDKILNMMKEPTGIQYIDSRKEKGRKMIIDFVFEFGRTGKVDVERWEGLLGRLHAGKFDI